MPSFTQNLALGAALLAGSVAAIQGASESCPISSGSVLSCKNTTAVANTCCFNSPGGLLLQTQFWDTTGPADSFTIHGLWPDNCDGTYQANCDAKRAYTDIGTLVGKANPNLLQFMQKYWTTDSGTQESFWEHEWGKHGTCISTFDPQCYTAYQPGEEVPDFFNKTVSLFQGLNSYQFLQAAGITPSSSKTYKSADVLAALAKGHSGMAPTVRCLNGAISEVWYYFNVRGSVQTGEFVPTTETGSGGSSNCPSEISYPPKAGGSSGGGSTTTTSSKPTPTPSKKTSHAPAVPRWL